MEKQNNQNCKGIFSRCHGEPAASVSVTKTKNEEIKTENSTNSTLGSKKPWSVFGDVYWV